MTPATTSTSAPTTGTTTPDVGENDIEREIGERAIRLEGAHNVRHLGGYPTAGGQRTGARDLIRSGGLQELTEAGLAALRELGVGTVVDFRSEAEREQPPPPDLGAQGITIIEAPVFEVDASPGALARQERYPGHAAIYEQFLTEGGGAYRTFFEAIALAARPLLFHCAVGKDRTGVAAALLLELAGTPDEYIIADYARSTVELAPVVEERLERFEAYGISEETGRMMMAAPPREMAQTLDFLRGRWGSAAGYLAAIGLHRSTIEAVRTRMLASPSDRG